MKMQIVAGVCKPILAIAILTSAFGPGLCGVSRAADWPNYRGPNHNGITNETDWKSNWGESGPEKLWEQSIGIGFSSMAVVGGKVYAVGNFDKKEDVLRCFDAETGRELWMHAYPCPLGDKYYEGGTLSTPTVDGDRVYSLSKMGSLFCSNAANGMLIWHKYLNEQMGYELPTWHFATSALVVGDMLILNIGDAGLALNKHTGDVIWSNGKGKCGYATPVPFVMNGQQGVAIFGKESLVAVSPRDGKKLWQYPWKTKNDVNAADPIFYQNYVFISSGYGHGGTVLEVYGSQVNKLWESKVMRTQINGCVLHEEYLYGFDEKELKCIDGVDGTEQWGDKSLGKGSLIMSADGRLIIMGDTGELVIAQANSKRFNALARAQILPKGKCWTTPVLANGKIYARNAAGDLVCVDVGG